MGDKCKLEVFCVPFGHRVGECTYLEIYICIGYHTSLTPLVSVIEIFNLTGPKIYKGNLIWTPWNFQIAVSRRRNKIF